MKIVLINAAAPDYSRKKRYSPSAFAEASVAFAATELEEGTISEAKLDGYHIWHASSLHARQTADMLIGTNTAISADETSLLDEIPLAPYTDKNQELPLWKYELMGYLGWRQNSRTQPEGRVESLQRGEELLLTLLRHIRQRSCNIFAILQPPPSDRAASAIPTRQITCRNKAVCSLRTHHCPVYRFAHH